MACKHSSVTVDIHHDGCTPLGVAFEGMEDDAIAHSNISGIFPFKHLPAELQNKIIAHAMTAVNREIRPPCLTNAAFKPGVAVSLFRVNHRIYHEAHYQIRKQNTFSFGNFGSDLNTITSAVGPLKCRTGACGYGTLYSGFAKVMFDLGDDDLPGLANDRVHAFGCALRYLRSQIIINSLHLQFAYFNFQSSTQLSNFASGLSKIKVQEKLMITGDEKILDMSFGELTSKLSMNMMPVYTQFWAYNPAIKYSPGSFFHHYVPEKHDDKGPDPQRKDLIVNKT